MKKKFLLIVLLTSVACAQRRVTAMQATPAPPPTPAPATVAQEIHQAVVKGVAEAVTWEVAQAVTQRVESKIAGHIAEKVQTAVSKGRVPHSRAERDYRSGTAYLDRRQWERAIEAFERVVENKSSRADGALYWKAYAQHKLGRRDEALSTLATLQSAHPNSRWLNDARQLEQEVRRASGQPVSPEEQTDEDLKLLALNALLHTEPERALPLLEKILLGASSPRLKERALFVLAQTDWPKGFELLARAARGGLNPDLQIKAVRFLGARRNPQASELLAEIYGATSDEAVKLAVIDGLAAARDKQRLLSAAKSESGDVRRRAIQGLAEARAEPELAQLYQVETAPEMRREILRALFAARAYERVTEIAKTEKDPGVRRDAIRLLGRLRRDGIPDLLRSLYTAETEMETRRSIIEALGDQKQTAALIEIARKETEPALKKQAVEALSRIKSKEANEFLIELLGK